MNPLVTVFHLVLQVLLAPVFLLVFLLHWPFTLLRKKPKQPKVIVITGANSGIGAALALQYAKQGVTLALTGRNRERLQQVATKCEAKGATVKQGAIDVCDEEELRGFLERLDDETPVDLVIANAGVSENTVGLTKDIAAAARTLHNINVVGVHNTVLPLLQRMKDRRSGQIAIVSSLASYGPLALGAAYAATKAAVKTYGLSLRHLLYRDNVFVNVVCPGFVRSPMTDKNKTSMPFMVEMQPAVAAIVSGLAADYPVVAFPNTLYTIVWLRSALPEGVADTLARLVPALGYLPGRRARRS